MIFFERYEQVKKDISEVCKRVSRDPSEITLLVVSKGQTESSILELCSCGVLEFGENRVVEAMTKQEDLPKNIRWHFIGSIQSNKIRKLVGNYELIHSVDSFEIAEKISKISQEKKMVTKVLIQVNTSKEESKHGLYIEEIAEQFHKFINLPSILFTGLMTMGPKNEIETTRKAFSDLRELKSDLVKSYPEIKPYFKELSMGMSQDFKIAIEEGATIVRVGSLIFSSH